MAVVAAIAASAMAPAVAQADSLGLTTSPDPAEDRPTTIFADAIADTSATLYMKVRNAGGAPCGTTRSTDVSDGNWLGSGSFGQSIQGARRITANTTFSSPGDYLVCAWIERYSSAANSTVTTATAALVVSVRSNATSVALGVPSQTDVAKPIAWSASVTTEVSRDVFVAIRPATAPGDTAPCGQSYSTKVGDFSSLGSSFGTTVQGTQTLTGVISANSLDDGALYLVCAWVQEGSSDTQAEAQTAGGCPVRRGTSWWRSGDQ